MKNFSFWKPDPIPVEAKIIPINLHPLGGESVVIDKLLNIPNTILLSTKFLDFNFKNKVTLILWDYFEGVTLKYTTDDNINPGEVTSISAISYVDLRYFYKLYLQLFEYFDVTLLDEANSKFITVKEFKKNFASRW